MSVEENLKTSERYHELDPTNMDEILTADFVGQQGTWDASWNLEQHKQNWSKNTAEDVIHEQFGSGDRVCTRFTRKGHFEGKYVEADILQIKTFRGPKIAHIWEYIDRKQWTEQMDSAQ